MQWRGGPARAGLRREGRPDSAVGPSVVTSARLEAPHRGRGRGLSRAPRPTRSLHQGTSTEAAARAAYCTDASLAAHPSRGAPSRAGSGVLRRAATTAQNALMTRKGLAAAAGTGL